MVCKNVHVDLPSKAVSAGQSFLSSVLGADDAYPVVSCLAFEADVVLPIMAAMPAILLAAPALDDSDGVFFFVLSLAQSCHELHTLHGFPSGSRISPGGRFGWVSFVVRRGAEDDPDCDGSILFRLD